jgi:alpha-glucoside transport system permease protein
VQAEPRAVEREPGWRAWLFTAPAIVLVAGWILAPSLHTLWLSLHDGAADRLVGFDNFAWLANDSGTRRAVVNTAGWVLLTAAASTALGLVFAGVAERLRNQGLVVTLVALPLAFSGVATAVLWRLVYSFRSPGQSQTGILNAFWSAIGGDPVAWLVQAPLNTLLLITTLIWVQASTAMVLLVVAIRRVPTDQRDAARIDGASALQVFTRITLPAIKGQIIAVVVITAAVAVKVYDVVVVSTGGAFRTGVVATEMFDQAFVTGHTGRGAALAVVVMVATLPLMAVVVSRIRRAEVRG